MTLNSNSKDVEIYLDVDGVLADFDKSMRQKRPTWLSGLEQQFLALVPELRDKTDVEVREFFAGKQTEPVLQQAKKIFNKYRSSIYAIMSKQGFFLNLEVYDEAYELVDGVTKLNGGKLPHILTAPAQSQFCKQEKEAWIAKHFSGKVNKFICQKEKYEFSGENSILIDDMTKNTVPWEQRGGFAILHKGNVADTLNKLKIYLETI